MRKLIKFTKKRLIKFQRSVRVVMILTLANLAPMNAEAKGHWRTDDFTSIPLQRNKRNINSGIFDQPQTSPTPSGSGNGNNSGDSTGPKSSQSQSSKSKSPYDNYRFSKKKKKLETCDDFGSDQNKDVYGTRDMKIRTLDDFEFNLTHNRVRRKSYKVRVSIFKDKIELPEAFDPKVVEKMQYKKRKAYLRDKNNLPDKSVWQMQDEIARFFRSPTVEGFNGYIGVDRIEGRICHDPETMVAGFIDRRTRDFITISDFSVD